MVRSSGAAGDFWVSAGSKGEASWLQCITAAVSVFVAGAGGVFGFTFICDGSIS